MKKLVMHIGLHKTGTTTVQNTLHTHRDICAKYGLLYPAFTANHSRFLYSVFSEHGHTLPINRINGIATTEKLAPLRKKARATFAEKFPAKDGATTLVSAEDLTRLPLMDVAAVKDAFAETFDEIQIIAYVRPPRSSLSSIFQQSIREGVTLTDLLDKPPVIDYRARLEPYFELFGENAITLRPFHRPQLYKGCIVADILHQLEAPDALYDAISVSTENESLSWPATLFLSAVNEQLPLFTPEGKLNPRRLPTLISNARNNLKGDKFELPYAYLSSVCQNQIQDILWMQEKLGVNFDEIDQQPDDAPALADFLRQKQESAFMELSLAMHTSERALQQERKQRHQQTQS